MKLPVSRLEAKRLLFLKNRTEAKMGLFNATAEQKTKQHSTSVVFASQGQDKSGPEEGNRHWQFGKSFDQGRTSACARGLSVSAGGAPSAVLERPISQLYSSFCEEPCTDFRLILGGSCKSRPTFPTPGSSQSSLELSGRKTFTLVHTSGSVPQTLKCWHESL